jgi:lipid A disaccharide synthetase
VTKAAVILPFEEPLLRAHGIDATFVGHPLLDRAQNMPTREEARETLGLSQSTKVLALFPGSRQQEIDRHIVDFVGTARELQSRMPGLEVIVSVAPTVALDSHRCPFRLVHSASLSVLRAADAALCKSGTTTLEASIADCPLVVAYRTGRISFALAKRLVKVQSIGLVNVVAGREVAPEINSTLLQEQAEKDLAAQVPAAAKKVEALRANRNYEQALLEIGKLRPAIDHFFDKVMVMTDDAKLRANRLALLQTLLKEFSTIADFSEIVTEGKESKESSKQ